MASGSASFGFNLADGHGYMLGRSYAASSRLNFQYYLWKESLRFSIHESVHVPHGARIADVVTGTAMWLIDVAREHPTAQLDGFDIDLSQAPPTQWLCPNITLKTWNLFEDVPDDLVGVYDIVHVRLLVLVVQKSDPKKVLHNLLRLLKPGGLIQWDELSYPDTRVKISKSSLFTPALDELRDIVYSQGRNDWTLRLPAYFAEDGLLDVKLYHFEDPPELTRANGEQHLLTMEEFASSLVRTDRKEEAKDLFKIIQDASDEWYKPDIGPRLKPRIRRVYEEWAGLTGNELISHLHRIRNKAWPHGNYPCIGEWIFLLPGISAFPRYPEVLARARSGDTVLDLGCCFGQDLRLLCADKASPQNMYATDISSELWNLGFELFNDREKMVANFLQADVLDPRSPLTRFQGFFDVVIANQFLHLFDWEGQVSVIKRIVEISKPGSILIGYQRAQISPKEMDRPWGKMYFHNQRTFKELWQGVEQETGSRWNLEVDLVDLREWGMEPEDFDWMPEGRKGINFMAQRRI